MKKVIGIFIFQIVFISQLLAGDKGEFDYRNLFIKIGIALAILLLASFFAYIISCKVYWGFKSNKSLALTVLLTPFGSALIGYIIDLFMGNGDYGATCVGFILGCIGFYFKFFRSPQCPSCNKLWEVKRIEHKILGQSSHQEYNQEKKQYETYVIENYERLMECSSCGHQYMTSGTTKRRV